MYCQVCGGAGSTVDGVNTMDICCSLKVFLQMRWTICNLILQGRFVTVQATDSSGSVSLEVAEILVTAGGEGCQVRGLRQGQVSLNFF